MRVYYSEQSLIFKGFNRYWGENDSFNKYFLYRDIKSFKHDNPIEFKNRSKYNIEDNEPLCYYGKQYISIPRKFLFTLKRFNLLKFRFEAKHKNQLHTMTEYACMHKKLCSEYYLPIFELGE